MSNKFIQNQEDFLVEHGRTFHPSTDSLIGKDYVILTAVPESWSHEKYGIVYDINEALNIINDEMDLARERDLDDKDIKRIYIWILKGAKKE